MNVFEGAYQGTSYRFEFKDGLNILYGYSGEGKTFLFDIVESCFQDSNIAYTRLNYNYENATVADIVACCRGKEVLLVDNADLFFTTEMLNAVQELGLIIVVSMHEWEYLKFTSAGFYRVVYNDNQLICKRTRSVVE